MDSLTITGGRAPLTAIAQHFAPALADVVHLAEGDPQLDLVLRTPRGDVSLCDL